MDFLIGEKPSGVQKPMHGSSHGKDLNEMVTLMLGSIEFRSVRLKIGVA